MTDYAKLAKDLHERNIGTYVDVGDTSVPAYPYDHLSEAAATALETLLEERNEWQAWAADGFAINEEKDRLTAENARLREALEHIMKQRAAIESGQIPRPIYNVLAAIDRARQALGEPND